jgi:hypothetical protein
LLGDGEVLSLFSYVVGNNQRLFASTEHEIFDITNIIALDGWILVSDERDEIVTDQGDNIGDPTPSARSR